MREWCKIGFDASKFLFMNYNFESLENLVILDLEYLGISLFLFEVSWDAAKKLR